ncbi:hypothetical protein [Labilibaculum antarcticum]|nr:hypothetical protein [Labilibaculum antarcticum]
MNKIGLLLFVCAISIGGVQAIEPEDITIDVNLNVKRSLGNVTSFD